MVPGPGAIIRKRTFSIFKITLSKAFLFAGRKMSNTTNTTSSSDQMPEDDRTIFLVLSVCTLAFIIFTTIFHWKRKRPPPVNEVVSSVDVVQEPPVIRITDRFERVNCKLLTTLSNDIQDEFFSHLLPPITLIKTSELHYTRTASSKIPNANAEIDARTSFFS